MEQKMYYSVSEYTVGTIPESGPHFCFSLSELIQYIVELIQDVYESEEKCGRVHMEELFNMKDQEELVVAQTDRMVNVTVKCYEVFESDFSVSSKFKDLTDDRYIVVYDSEDIEKYFSDYRKFVMPYEPDSKDITGIFLKINEGPLDNPDDADFAEVWVTDSSKPFLNDTVYTRVFCL